jgi:hypothetical protein
MQFVHVAAALAAAGVTVSAHAQGPRGPLATSAHTSKLGTQPSPAECTDAAKGCYRSPDGTWRAANEAYRLRPQARDPNYLRTAAELGGALMLGTAGYVAHRGFGALAWHGASWRKRFHRSAYRYDNNPFRINFLGHALSGAAYYGLSRANDLSMPESALSAFVASWTWEFLLEFHGAVSMNDQLLTPVAGIAIGEFFHLLGRYLTSAPADDTPGLRALQWTAGLPVTAHRALDGSAADPVRDESATDERGLSADIAARFRVSYGPALVRPHQGTRHVTHGIRFDGWLAAIPGYLRAGEFRQPFMSANVTSFRLRAGVGADGWATELAADTVLLGLHRQNLRGKRGALHGDAVTLGMHVSYFHRRTQFEHFVDRLGLVGLPGLALDTRWFAAPAVVRISMRAQPEFAGVYSSVFDSWQRNNPGETAKAILHEQDYYYGWGGSTRARVELCLPHVRVGSSVRFGAWRSHDGFGRSAELVTVRVPSRDRMLDYEAWLRLRPFDLGLFLEGIFRGHWRHSAVAELGGQRSLLRYEMHLGMEL